MNKLNFSGALLVGVFGLLAIVPLVNAQVGAGVSGSASGNAGSGAAQVDVGGEAVICTMDAYQCPDGSWVGRTGPNCEFVCDGAAGGNPDHPVSSDDPIPVEPDGGIGDGAGPTDFMLAQELAAEIGVSVDTAMIAVEAREEHENIVDVSIGEQATAEGDGQAVVTYEAPTKILGIFDYTTTAQAMVTAEGEARTEYQSVPWYVRIFLVNSQKQVMEQVALNLAASLNAEVGVE